MAKDGVTVSLARASTIEIMEHIHGKSVRGKKFRRVRHDGVTSSRAMQPDDRGKFISIGGGEKTIQSNFLSAGIKAHSRLSHEVRQKVRLRTDLGRARIRCAKAPLLLQHCYILRQLPQGFPVGQTRNSLFGNDCTNIFRDRKSTRLPVTPIYRMPSDA